MFVSLWKSHSLVMWEVLSDQGINSADCLDDCNQMRLIVDMAEMAGLKGTVMHLFCSGCLKRRLQHFPPIHLILT